MTDTKNSSQHRHRGIGIKTQTRNWKRAPSWHTQSKWRTESQVAWVDSTYVKFARSIHDVTGTLVMMLVLYDNGAWACCITQCLSCCSKCSHWMLQSRRSCVWCLMCSLVIKTCPTSMQPRCMMSFLAENFSCADFLGSLWHCNCSEIFSSEPSRVRLR